jgi:DNA-binding NarL/FixJ family response regulator
MKILIGDDRIDVIRAMKNALSNLEVITALTPDKTIELAESAHPDVLVTDLQYTQNGTEGYRVLIKTKDIVPVRILFTAAANHPSVKYLSGVYHANFLYHKNQFSELVDFLNLNFSERRMENIK